MEQNACHHVHITLVVTVNCVLGTFQDVELILKFNLLHFFSEFKLEHTQYYQSFWIFGAVLWQNSLKTSIHQSDFPPGRSKSQEVKWKASPCAIQNKKNKLKCYLAHFGEMLLLIQLIWPTEDLNINILWNHFILL